MFAKVLYIYLLAIVFHEAGHYLFFRFNKGKKIRWHIKKKRGFLTIAAGEIKDYLHLTDSDLINVNLIAIVMGFIPIYIWTVLFNDVYLFVYVPYIVGCGPDLGIIKYAAARYKQKTGKSYFLAGIKEE